MNNPRRWRHASIPKSKGRAEAAYLVPANGMSRNSPGRIIGAVPIAGVDRRIERSTQRRESAKCGRIAAESVLQRRAPILGQGVQQIGEQIRIVYLARSGPRVLLGTQGKG